MLLLLCVLLVRVEGASSCGCKGRLRRGRLCPHSIVCRNSRQKLIEVLLLPLPL